jgi:CRP/FNR family cyclic AMP-dependent transcriptional regulator
MTFTSAFSNNFRFQQLKRVGLSDTTCRMLHDVVSIRSYEAADVIVKKGSNFDHWHLVIEGLVASSVSISPTKLAPINIYGEGAWFGEQSILTSQPSFEDYVCLTSTEVMRLPASAMRKLLDTEAEFPHYVSRNIAWKFQKSSEMLMLMKFCNPAVRVVLGLAQVGEALAQSAGNQVGNKADAGVEIRVKQEILAALCGVSRTLFSECILKLESSGWLRLSYGKLRLCKMNAWLELTKSHRINRVTDPNSSFDQLLYQLGGSNSVSA